MDKDTLENIGIGAVIIGLAIVLVAFHAEYIPLSGAIGFVIMLPVYFILDKTKYGYKHKWVAILQGVVIIITHIVLCNVIG